MLICIRIPDWLLSLYSIRSVDLMVNGDCVFSVQDLNSTLDEFEEMFKTKAQGPAIDVTSSKQKTSQKGPNKILLLDSNRAKNLAITLRKVGKTSEEICRAIQM